MCSTYTLPTPHSYNMRNSASISLAFLDPSLAASRPRHPQTPTSRTVDCTKMHLLHPHIPRPQSQSPSGVPSTSPLPVRPIAARTRLPRQLQPPMLHTRGRPPAPDGSSVMR
ncbi:hypothetical protein C8Q74DRAFT_485995 [Fomes fomentarius]|nr:hypothetical protein C8Q74DRAFT_485995 [Fomes fomentarius]